LLGLYEKFQVMFCESVNPQVAGIYRVFNGRFR